MIRRALVHVAGHAGSGKTTLIERLLESNRSKLLMVARGVLDDRVRDVRESASPRKAELKRYRQADASNVVEYRFAASTVGTDAFFCSEFMTDYSHAVLIEGDSPLGFPPDVTVCVLLPLPRGASLLRRVTGDARAARALEPQEIQGVLDAPDGPAKLVGSMLEGSPGRPVSVSGEIAAEARRDLTALLERTRAAGPRPARTRWALADGYAGVEHAQVVVINVRSAGERRRAERMLPELARLREDQEVFDDIIGWQGNRLPVTTAVADLSDRTDAGVRRVLTRIKRAFRNAG